MHTALISGMSVDAANRFLVTASHDKTVRVWDLTTGRLLQVLRPPVRAGNEGKLYAAAVSPDGAVVAAAGLTGYTWDKVASLYVFRMDNGTLLRRFSGFIYPVTHLAYSPDGQFLAAASTGRTSLRVYRIQEATVVARDTYSGTSYSADFSVAGYLVTASYDGFIRLYDRALNLRVTRQAPGGTRPFTVAFSPDGSRVAVGFRDAASVDILEAGTLAPLYSPDTTAVERGGVSSVCWSADGQWLYAGGLHRVRGAYALRRWAEGGRGAYTDIPVADSLITHLLPLHAGGVVFATGAPAFGIVDAAGQPRLLQGPAGADLRDIHTGLLLSHDGMTVQFSYEAQGQAPARFALRERALILAPPDDATLVPPRTTAPGVDLTGWERTTSPALNGKALRLAQSEVARSAAIAPDHQSVLLGTEWFLRLFDRRGVERWSIPAPAPVWGVNIAGNGQLAVAAFGDGTLHWYRLRDGQELLTFFPHRDRKRWVLWTPSGYYDAAPEAEQFLGWLVDRGALRAAAFLPMAPFRSTFFRPDVVTRTLETLDEAEALRRANAAGAHH
jgi:WD40 repeat protein